MIKILFFSKSFTEIINGVVVLNKGCQLAPVCSIINMNTNNGLNTCCTSDFCNNQILTPSVTTTTAPFQPLLCLHCTNCGDSIGVLQACPSTVGYVCYVNIHSLQIHANS